MTMDDEEESSDEEYLPSEETNDSDVSPTQGDTVTDEETFHEEILDETKNEYDDKCFSHSKLFTGK